MTFNNSTFNNSAIKITDLNLKSFNGVNKIEGDMIETFYFINIANHIRVRYNQNNGIVESLKVNGDDVSLDNPEIIASLNAALEAESQRQQKSTVEQPEQKPKVTINDLSPSALYGVRKIEGDVIETYNWIDLGTTTSVRYNERTGEVEFVKVNGKEIPLDNPEIIAQFNEALEALVPPTGKKL